MATTWLKSVNFSLWPYAGHFSMKFYHSAHILEGNFLGFQTCMCMQDWGTFLCSRFTIHNLHWEGNTSMQYFPNTGLGMTFTPFLFHAYLYLKLCHTNIWYCPSTTGNSMTASRQYIKANLTTLPSAAIHTTPIMHTSNIQQNVNPTWRADQTHTEWSHQICTALC